MLANVFFYFSSEQVVGMKVLRIKDPIPIQIDYDIAYYPYQFEYNWTSVNNTFVNFNQSYLELQVETTAYNDATKKYYLYDENFDNYYQVTKEQLVKHILTTLEQEANTYCLIDSVDVEMVYGLPDGTQRALKYHEPCVHATRGRKMIVLKETSRNDLDKSVYAEDLSIPCDDMCTLRYVRQMAGKTVTIAIPLNLICGLGTDADTLINVKHLKMFFRTATLNSIVECNPSRIFYPSGVKTDATDSTFMASTNEVAWFQDFRLKGATMNLMTYQGVQFNSNELYKTIPSYVQIDYQYQKLEDTTFLLNRALPYLPEYILFWFTKGYSSTRVRNDPLPGVWPKYISCLIGNTQMFPQSEFPVQNYGHFLSLSGKPRDNDDTDKPEENSYSVPMDGPNKLLYSLWADHSHPETKLNFDKWMKYPIFIIPCSALMDVRSNSGVELNMECKLDVNIKEDYTVSKLVKPDGIEATTKHTTNGSWAQETTVAYDEPDAYAEEIGYNLESHNGYVTQFVKTINSSSPLTLHMLAVRTIRDI